MSVRIERIQVKRGEAAKWAQINFPLRAGEYGLELDTGKFKVGDGISPWNSLPYFVPETEIDQMIATAIAQAGVGNSDPRIGVMTDLSTTNQDTIVEAINEINVPPQAYTALYTNAKA